MHPPLPMRGCNVTTKPVIFFVDQNVIKTRSLKGCAFRSCLCELRNQFSMVLLRFFGSRSSTYNSSGLQRQDNFSQG